MSSQVIKSGLEVVNDFLSTADSLSGVNAATLAAVRELHAEGKLTDTKLSQKLAALRDTRKSELATVEQNAAEIRVPTANSDADIVMVQPGENG